MREIMFRGKRVEIGPFATESVCEWAYGGYAQDSSGTYIYDFMRPKRMVKVNPATVGQYTGLKDKNGVKIFEGDLIKYDGRVFEMKYIDGFSAFSLRSVDNMILAPCITPNTCPRMEVIGNVWDNPELLEEVRDG